jgi:rhodanese-related sulfurtransferase
LQHSRLLVTLALLGAALVQINGDAQGRQAPTVTFSSPQAKANSSAPIPMLTDLQILDVRTPEEFAENSLQVAVNIDVTGAKFKDELRKLDKSKTYKLYCRSGKRSALAEKIMRAEGFQSVENLGSLGEAAAKLQLACRNSPCPAAN